MHLKPNYPWNILVFPAASEAGLEIYRALSDSKEVVLHGANQSGFSIAQFYFRRLHNLPHVSDLTCLDALQQIIVEQNIDAIMPAHDDALMWLATHVSKIKCAIISSDAQICKICRSKRTTYENLKSVIRVPKLFEIGDKKLLFPVFVKPDCGQGSQRARKIYNQQQLDTAIASEPDLIIMEDIPGPEYTVDCFSRNGELLYARARSRLQTKMGIASLSASEDMPVARQFAEKILTKLPFHGAWFFQIKEIKDGEFCLLEAAPRIAGSMALSRVSGPNFPLLSLYQAAGHDVHVDAFENQLCMGRSLDVTFLYDRPVGVVYVDLDDTLIVRGEINTKLVALIFHFHNRKIPVHLITRHKESLQETLAKFRISNIFDSIIHLQDHAVSKADLIEGPNAVLIDDSYSERHASSQRSSLRCFDAAGAACLFDERK